MNDRRQFRILALGSWVSHFGSGVTALTVLLALSRWSENPAWLISCYAVAGIVRSRRARRTSAWASATGLLPRSANHAAVFR